MREFDCCMTIHHTYGVAHTISVRLDDEAHRALLAIQDTGLTSSEAVRAALLREAARVRSKEVQRAEFLAAQADPDEQRILRESLEFMETIDGPW